jgi:hypothetical protein
MLPEAAVGAVFAFWGSTPETPKFPSGKSKRDHLLMKLSGKLFLAVPAGGQNGCWLAGYCPTMMQRMTVLTFDTLKYVNTLKKAGFTPELAEAQAGALSDVLEVNLKELATKGDLAQLEQRIDSKFVQLEQRMTIKLGAMMAVGAVVALLKLL